MKNRPTFNLVLDTPAGSEVLATGVPTYDRYAIWVRAIAARLGDGAKRDLCTQTAWVGDRRLHWVKA